MSPAAAAACARCLRRSWLLAVLGARLDYRCRDPERFMELLALEDDVLLDAIGGRRRGELKERYSQFGPQNAPLARGVASLCRHDRRFPRALKGPWAPRALHVTGDWDRLAALAEAPVVAIVGTRLASDYGMEMAKSIARGLAASGVTVVSELADGIAVAAHAGALEVNAGSAAVLGGGLDVACPASRRSLYERLLRSGCALSELPCGWPARRWGRAACRRTVAGLAGLMIVVEASASQDELATARIAQALGRRVAAVPGRVTSPASLGTHELLIGGAPLVRGAEDALELLPGTPALSAAASPAGLKLEPRLERVLERVGAGADTPDKLTRAGEAVGDVLLALSELELMGRLARGDGGRYVPRQALEAPPAARRDNGQNLKDARPASDV